MRCIIEEKKGNDMLDKLQSLSNNSKYTAWYFSIITRAKDRELSTGYERHHIVPKSLVPEYAADKDNIVRLTYREHFICHALLVRMLINKEHRSKMAYALWRLLHKRKHDGGIVNSVQYEMARSAYSAAMTELWKDPTYKAKVVASKKWFYDSPEQKEANRQKALKEMQNVERKEKFVQAGLQAGKRIRDADTKAWIAKSLGSEESKKRARQSCQTPEFREFCKNRELNKSAEDRQRLAKQGQQALMEKCGGEEAYRKMLSDRIKGRKAYINPVTGQVKVAYECPNGFVPKVRIIDDL